MDTEIITIIKKPSIKNCVRINNEKDIPEYLKDSVKVNGDSLILDCIEGEEKAPLGSVIAYEKLDNGKMNVWNKANWKETTREENGVFYEIPKPYHALRVTNNLPESIIKALGERLSISENGEYQIETKWGIAKCAPYNGYLVIYSTKKLGSLDVNFLNKDTPSFKEYFVADETGNIIETLEEYDIKMTEQDDLSNSL